MLDDEAKVIEEDALDLRARQEAEALREQEARIAEVVQSLANAGAHVDEALADLREALAAFFARLNDFFAATGGISPQPKAVQALGMVLWGDRLAEILGRAWLEITGRTTGALPLGSPDLTFSGPVGNPAAIVRNIAAALRARGPGSAICGQPGPSREGGAGTGARG